SIFVPLETMPDWMVSVASHSPLTHTADAARALAIRGEVLRPALLAILWAVSILALVIPLSVRRYRRVTGGATRSRWVVAPSPGDARHITSMMPEVRSRGREAPTPVRDQAAGAKGRCLRRQGRARRPWLGRQPEGSTQRGGSPRVAMAS